MVRPGYVMMNGKEIRATAEELNAEHDKDVALSLARHPAGFYWVYTRDDQGKREGRPVIVERSEQAIWYLCGVDMPFYDHELEVICRAELPNA